MTPRMRVWISQGARIEYANFAHEAMGEIWADKRGFDGARRATRRK